MSQSRMDRSQLPEAKVRPDGWMANEVTAPLWPVKDFFSVPVVASQSLTVESQLAEAMVWPSAVKATQVTSPA